VQRRRVGSSGLQVSRIGLGTMTWGDDTDGSLGDGGAPGHLEPAVLESLAPALELATHGASVCARLVEAGEMRCWGRNLEGQLGTDGLDNFEAPVAPAQVAGVAISNGDKLLYPEAKGSKRDLAEYYVAIGDWIVPHLEDRPLTLVRCPNGWDKPCFYQKHAKESISEFIDRIDIREGGGEQPYMMANNVTAVVALVQMGVLELHPWGSRAPKLGYPDRLIFDFDPDETLPWERLVEAVNVLRKLLDTLGLRAFLKTTGGKGLHVVVPVAPTRAWAPAKAFCKAIAELLVCTFPDRFTAKMTKSTREGRIFVDYLRNAENATAIAPYSARAKRNAPVAMPIAWEQLKQDLRNDHFNIRNVPGLLKRRRRDPWAELADVDQELTDAMLRQVGVTSS